MLGHHRAKGDVVNGLTVIPPAVPFQEFQKHLNATTKTSADDEEMETTLSAATGIAEGIAGPLVIRQFTSRVSGAETLLLPKYPVVDVLTLSHALAADGPYATADVAVDTDSGIVALRSRRRFWFGSWVVTYTAGRGEVADLIPEDIRLAVSIIGKHLWETQRGATSRPGMLGRTSSVDPAERVPMGFAIPNRAVALLEPYAQSDAVIA